METVQVLARQVTGQLRDTDEVLTALSIDDQNDSPDADEIAINSH